MEISRRYLLKTSGISALNTSFIGTASAHLKDDTVEIVTDKGRDGRPIRIKEVPKKWYDYTKRVDATQEHIANQHNPITNVEVEIDRSEFVAGRYKSKLIARYDPDKGLNIDLPNHLNDIPIEARPERDIQLDSCGKIETVTQEGGIAVDMDDSTGPGSWGCKVEYNGKKYMITAAHVIGENCTHAGNAVYNYNTSGHYIGDVAKHSKSLDFAIIPRQNTDVYFDNTIYNNWGELAGHKTYQGIKDLFSTGETVYQQGWKTCTTSGQVINYDVSSGICNYSASDYVKTSAATEGGDSGGPHFDKFTYNGCDYVSIISIHHGGESLGAGAYAISDYFGTDSISFEPDTFSCMNSP